MKRHIAMEHLNIIKIFKMASGTFLSIILAEVIGLNYSPSAGIVTLLSIHDTKKETIRVMQKRVISFCAALLLAFLSFKIFGYSPEAIGIFVFLFAAVCSWFHMMEGVSVNTVLMTHFFTEKSMALPLVWNELLLLGIGATIGVLLNFYIPGKKKYIQLKQQQIEGLMKDILNTMGDALSGSKAEPETSLLLVQLKLELSDGEKNALEDMENTLLSDTRYYISYMGMRKSQRGVLLRIYRSICHLELLPAQADEIARLFWQISSSFHEYNNALVLLEELEQVKSNMRAKALPVSRSEFESRAVLFHILLDLEQFLLIKREFVEGLSEKEIYEFWEARTSP